MLAPSKRDLALAIQHLAMELDRIKAELRALRTQSELSAKPVPAAPPLRVIPRRPTGGDRD